MQILYITRKFPPMKGGMESAAYGLYMHLSELADLDLVKLKGSNKFLVFALPYYFLKSCFIILKKKTNIVYLQDGLLAPLGVILKIFGKPIVVTVHGLDITYKNMVYQQVIPWCLKRFDKIICVSDSTRYECIKRGIPAQKTITIPDGVSDTFHLDRDKHELREIVAERLGISIQNRRILLSVGRLVERKGFHWFVENVIPEIVEKEKKIIYLIVGVGPFRNEILKQISKKELKNHVSLIGEIDDETLKLIYNVSDVLVMPNISVKGDMEGFGIVALEASSCGVPIVASRLEGVTDAVKDQVNGFLVEPHDIRGYVTIITDLLRDGVQTEYFSRRAREFTLKTYAWERIAGIYMEEFEKIINKQLT